MLIKPDESPAFLFNDQHLTIPYPSLTFFTYICTMKRIAFVLVFVILSVISVSNTASAQCSMCTINAEQGAANGNTQTKGINTGVLYLMAIPYLMIGALGVLWYLKYRKKSVRYE